jgi:hypothetical protein
MWLSGFIEAFLVFLGIYHMQTDSEHPAMTIQDRLISIAIFVFLIYISILPQVEDTNGTISTFFLPQFFTVSLSTIYAVLSLIAISRAILVIRAWIHSRGFKK